MFNNLIEFYLSKITEVDRGVGRGDQTTEYDHQCVDLYAHALKNLLAVSGMLGADHSGRGRSYDDGRSRSYDDGRGRSYDDGRGMSYNDGRGMSRGGPMYGGYSGDSVGDLVNATNRAMATMPEDMRQEAQRFIERLQRSQMR